jgi:hypothetical protein
MKGKLIAMSMMAFVAMAMLGSQAAYADEYAYTEVLIGVLTDKSFTVTMNGQAATASDPTHPGTATEVVWFNSTDGNTKYVNATIVGADDQVGSFPVCETPIAVFKNVGTVTLEGKIVLNNTVAGMVFFYNASNATGSMTGTPATAITTITTTASSFVTGLGINNETNICIWANFTSVPGGQHNTWLNWTAS